MKQLTVILAFWFLTSLGGCTAALNSSTWDSWIGHNWHEYANAVTNCTKSGSELICYKPLGTLIWDINNDDILVGWEYRHRR